MAPRRPSGAERPAEGHEREARRRRATSPRCPLFAQLSAKDRRVVAKALGVHDVAADVMLVRQGESGDTFYVLLEGRRRSCRNGRKVVTLGPGSGSASSRCSIPRPATPTS